MFKSKREPRIGDFIKLILILEPDKFTSFESIYQFLFELFPIFKTEFFDEEYLRALVREPDPESESEPEEVSNPIPLSNMFGDPNKMENVVEGKKQNVLDMTGPKSNQEIQENQLNVPSFGNLGSINKTQNTNPPPEDLKTNPFV